MRQHLALIAADEEHGLVEIAWTDADAKAQLRHARLFHVSELDAAADFAAERNATPGVNVYVGAALRREDANRGRRAKASDVMGTRVLWFDADHDAKATVDKAMSGSPAPNVLVRTGAVPSLRVHGYWQLPELLTDHAAITGQLKALVAHLGTDPAVTDPPRVLRMAGSVTWPKKPGRVPEVVGYRATTATPSATSLESLRTLYPPSIAVGSADPRREAAPAAPIRPPVIVTPKLLAELRDALRYIETHDYHTWERIGEALKTLGEAGWDLWHEWSATSEAYEPDEAERKWQSFKAERTGYAAIFAEAQRRGWRNPMSRQAQIEAGSDGRPAVAPLRASDLLKNPPPSRQWMVRDLIPASQVTELRGDGGGGKSTLALQLCVSVVAEAPWLGMAIEHGGPAFYLASEDDTDELHRRLSAIAGQAGVDRTALNDLHVWPLATEDPALAAPSGQGIGQTQRWAELVEHIERIRPALVVLDSRADVFAGEEINRQQVRAFIGWLRELAVRTGVAVVVLAHPSQSGKSDGTGNSGSTHWGNAVRSALYLSVVKGHDGEADTGKRQLAVVKSNYGPGGISLRLSWSAGAFVNEHGGAVPLSVDEERLRVDRLFLSLLDKCEAQGRIVSDRSGPNYAPAAFARMPAAAGVTAPGFKVAMERLFHANRIRVVRTGRPSNGRWKLERVTAATDFNIAQPAAA
ncbi:MAG: AAA family ATPase [Phenylobacterium sp.]|nr:AAA family ATPase [Phenylobacterium sp.]